MLGKYKYQVYLLLVALICYWPLTFYQSTLLCDDIDVALPTKYFAGECYQNGILPLWNPFQIWGSPAHADLQYTNWSPEVMLVGTLFGYNYTVLHVLFLGYLFLAGLGMYLLARYLSKQERIAFWIACIYMLSGVITGHVQSLVTILGLVWIPYLILHFLRLLDKPNLVNTIRLCIFAYLALLLGYQAFAFMILPVFVVLFAQRCITYYRHQNMAAIKQLFLWSGVALFIMLLVLSPVLVTQWQSRPFVSRLNGMPLREVMSNPFPPAAMASVVNPLLTLGHDDFFQTDTTMRNLFFGIIPLMLLVVSFFKKGKTVFEWTLLIFAAIYLLGSFGDALPVRAWMYHLLPGFKLFRFPALLRVIVFVCLLCYLSLNMQDVVIRLFNRAGLRKILLLAGMLLCALIAVIAGIYTNAFQFFKAADMFSHRVTRCSPFELALYMSVFQFLLLFLVFVVSNKVRLISRFINTLMLATCVELAVMITVYGQFTAFTDLKPAHFQDAFAIMPKKFPVPSQDAVMDNNDKFNDIHGFWRNTGCYKKQLSLGDEWTSYYFTNFDFIVNHLAYLRDSLNNYPFIYFSKLMASETAIALPVDTSARFITATFHHNNAKGSVHYKSYTPNAFCFECKTDTAAVLNLQQSYFSGWTATIDGKPAVFLWNAGLLMSVALSPGTHQVEFRFENPWFERSLLLSYALLLVLLLVLIFRSHLKAKHKYLYAMLVLGTVVCCVVVFHIHTFHGAGAVRNTVAFGQYAARDYDLGNKEGFRLLMEQKEEQKHVPGRYGKGISYTWRNFYNAPELWYALGYTGAEYSADLNGKLSFTPGKFRRVFTEDFRTVPKEFVFHVVNQHLDTIRECILDRHNPYTQAREVPVSYIKDAIYGSLWVSASQRAQPLVVCSVKHTDGNEEVLYYPLNKYLVYDSQTQKIPYYFNLKDKVQKDDVVKLFVMNDKDAQVLIADWVCEVP
ncbi:MAG: hypothetical protein JST26_00980 [Bacteroidetes bacterium]|nr:hypothetical protein [Bacteroidota bacterium]